jgi:L-tryptophan--pyruvate aminotransferase
MFEYWHFHRLSSWGTKLSMPADYRVEYQMSGPAMLNRVYSEKDTEGLGGKLNTLVRKLHAKFGNIDTRGKYIVFAQGASQLTSATIAAFKNQTGRELTLFAPAPYYFVFPWRCAFLPGYCKGFNSSEEQPPADLLEVVTIPNNPDGNNRSRAIYPGKRFFFDAVYYWPSLFGSAEYNMTPLVGPVTLFSFTKLTGHAGSRFGWAVVEDPYFAETMSYWDAIMNAHVAVEQAFRASLLLDYMAGDGGDHFMNWVRGRIADRWKRFKPALASQPLMQIDGRENTQYAWVYVRNKTDVEIDIGCQGAGLEPERGIDFGKSGHIRFNLMEHEVTFMEVLRRIPLIKFPTLPPDTPTRGADPRAIFKFGP